MNFQWNMPFKQVSHYLRCQAPPHGVWGVHWKGEQDHTQRHTCSERDHCRKAHKRKGALYHRSLWPGVEEGIYPALALPDCDQHLLSCEHTRNLDLSSWPKTRVGRNAARTLPNNFAEALVGPVIFLPRPHITHPQAVPPAPNAVETCQLFSQYQQHKRPNHIIHCQKRTLFLL